MIEVKNITRTFGKFKAVDDISFTVKKGEILGLIGPNGAGKSTLLRLITNYLHPTSGQIVIDNKLLQNYESLCKSKIGYLPEQAPIYQDMLVINFLSFICQIRNIAKKDRPLRLKDTIDKCQLEDVLYKKIGHLSKGFRQRVAFAQSILHNPDILILDEPTDGLDPEQKETLREVIRSYNKDKIVIFSTHILEEIQLLATRVVLLNQGKIKVAEDKDSFCKRGDLVQSFKGLIA